MEKINANLIAKIRAAAFPDELSAVGVRLSVVKNVFAMTASVYFTAYLFAVGGYEVEISRSVAYLSYPAFLFSTYALAYELVSYGVQLYAENLKFLRYVTMALCLVAFAAGTVAHFGMI